MIAAAFLLALPLSAKPQAQTHFDNPPAKPVTTPARPATKAAAKPAAHAGKMHQTAAKAHAKTAAKPQASKPAGPGAKAPKTAVAAHPKVAGAQKTAAAIAKSKAPKKPAIARKPAKKNSKLVATGKPKAPARAPAPKPAEKPAALVPVSAPAPARAPEAAKRDPFLPLLYQHDPSGPSHLPPGVAGLMVSTVRVDGTVEAPNGLIAVVSNPEQHVYFVREGDRLYDGQVEKIGPDGVTFLETSKDAFGKPVERTVTKRIYATAGEQQ